MCAYQGEQIDVTRRALIQPFSRFVRQFLLSNSQTELDSDAW
jgi:hypothetical protein